MSNISSVTQSNATNLHQETQTNNKIEQPKVDQVEVKTVNQDLTLEEANAIKNGTNIASAQIQIAKANGGIVDRLTSYPRTAGVKDLISDLRNKPSSYQANVINTLIYKDPERASSLLSQGTTSQYLANALSHAYNAKGSNGRSVLYSLVKNGIGTNMITAGQEAYNIGNLIARSGNAEMMKDFSEVSLTYAHQLRNTNPSADQISTALTNGALNAASGNSKVLQGLINSGKINQSDIAISAATTADSLGRALNVAAKGGFGTHFFLEVAGNSSKINSNFVRNAMVNYFNKMGGQLVNRLNASGNGANNANKLSEFFGKIVLPNDTLRKSAFSENGGFAKAFAAGLSQIDKSRTAGSAIGNLLGALDKGLQMFSGKTKKNNDLKGSLINLFKKVPIVGKIPGLIGAGKKVASSLANKPVNTSTDLSKALNISISDALIQLSQEAENRGDHIMRDKLIDFRNQVLADRRYFIDNY